jgi:hypothetical protein
MLPIPGVASLKRVEPCEHRLTPIPLVVAEREVRHPAGARLGPNPTHREIEKLGDLVRIEQRLGHRSPTLAVVACRYSSGDGTGLSPGQELDLRRAVENAGGRDLDVGRDGQRFWAEFTFDIDDVNEAMKMGEKVMGTVVAPGFWQGVSRVTRIP